MDTLNSCVEALVDSYDAYGLINHSGGPNLPSRDDIAEILKDLDALLFPGFRSPNCPEEGSLKMLTSERIQRVARRLSREVEKSLAFQRRNGSYHCDGEGCTRTSRKIVEDFFSDLLQLRRVLSMDVMAAYRGDPAAKSVEEVIVAYPGLFAISVHRIAHFFWQREVPLIPRIMSEIVHGKTGIDIHPGASIGEAFFIDHGTGVVIGETTVIGKNVKVYQGVTLGALSVKKEESEKKRHPSIGDNVTIYAGATILGGQTSIGNNCTIGGNVWLTESLPAGTTILLKGSEYEIVQRPE